jgi:hypothetical protein
MVHDVGSHQSNEMQEDGKDAVGRTSAITSWHSRIADRTFGIIATTIHVCRSTNGTPSIVNSSSEQTHYILNRGIETTGSALRLNTIPDDTMRNHKSTAQEKEEDAEHILAI